LATDPVRGQRGRGLGGGAERVHLVLGEAASVRPGGEDLVDDQVLEGAGCAQGRAQNVRPGVAGVSACGQRNEGGPGAGCLQQRPGRACSMPSCVITIERDEDAADGRPASANVLGGHRTTESGDVLHGEGGPTGSQPYARSLGGDGDGVRV